MRRHLPGFNQIANLGIATKLGLIVTVLAIPICALMFVQYQDRQSATSQSQDEANGLDYVAAVMPFLNQVQLHRGLAERVLRGDTAAKANMDRTAAAADDALANINALDKKWGGDFKTREMVAFINTEWPKARDAQSSTTDSNALHNSVISQGILPLISTVSNESGLALDPDLGNRNLIEALTSTLPSLTESLSQMRAAGAGALIARKGLDAGPDTKAFMAGQMALANAQAAELSSQLEAAMRDNGRFETDLRPVVTRSASTRATFMDNTKDQIMDAPVLSGTGAEGYFLLGGSAIDYSNELLASASDALKTDFNDRADSARTSFATYGTASLVGIVLALGLALFISATITRPMRHLAEVADRMSLGELDVDIDVEGTNEIGQLAESLRRMQASLRSAIERLRQRRSAAA
ncbi:MAG: HAMP domain-containing protein [Dehalococcoidia bacterium]|jgi:HAMP domain-containing protein